MTAAGDAVLAMARSQVGVTEQPPGSNQVPYWDWYGGNYGSWCACFVSWCNWHANYPLCAVDSAKGFILVSSGTVHSYPEGEAQSTAGLQPGDCVLFSWYPWQFIDGVPIIVNDPEWSGYVAGDHTGIFAYWIDQSTGQFACVEGNTSQSSWDNGGAVLERTDRYTSQVCGWWRVPSMEGSGPGAGPGPAGQDEDMYSTCLVVTEGSRWKGSVFMCAGGRAVGMNDASIVANLQQRGLAGPTIEVQEWDIYGGYEVVYPSGPGAMG
jgi:hypothetical protein